MHFNFERGLFRLWLVGSAIWGLPWLTMAGVSGDPVFLLGAVAPAIFAWIVFRALRWIREGFEHDHPPEKHD